MWGRQTSALPGQSGKEEGIVPSLPSKYGAGPPAGEFERNRVVVIEGLPATKKNLREKN